MNMSFEHSFAKISNEGMNNLSTETTSKLDHCEDYCEEYFHSWSKTVEISSASDKDYSYSLSTTYCKNTVFSEIAHISKTADKQAPATPWHLARLTS